MAALRAVLKPMAYQWSWGSCRQMSGRKMGRSDPIRFHSGDISHIYIYFPKWERVAFGACGGSGRLTGGGVIIESVAPYRAGAAHWNPAQRASVRQSAERGPKWWIMLTKRVCLAVYLDNDWPAAPRGRITGRWAADSRKYCLFYLTLSGFEYGQGWWGHISTVGSCRRNTKCP